jgi:hypothetical protein
MVVRELGEEKGLKTFRDIAKNGFSVRKGHTLLAGWSAPARFPSRSPPTATARRR